VRLVNSSIGYDNTQDSASNGQAYFTPLQNGTYDLEVQAPGYEIYSGSVTISGQTAKSIDIRPSN
jgi:hypothetical protein